MDRRFSTMVALAACAVLVLWAANGFSAVKAVAKPDFNKMDANGDGKVTEAEFDTYVISCPELGLTKTVYKEWDRNQDGVVTVQEFEQVQPMKEKAAPAKEEQAPNKEGAVTKDEAAK